MRTYNIIHLGTVVDQQTAENAIDALSQYCAEHPDDDTGFPRGQLYCDENHGDEWANIQTDAGRIAAELAAAE